MNKNLPKSKKNAGSKKPAPVPSQEWVRGSAKHRNQLMQYLPLAMILGIAAFLLFKQQLKRLQLPTGQPCLQAMELADLLRWTGLGLIVIAGLLAFWLLSIALRIQQNQQYPPPGMVVLRDTLIRRGGDATPIAAVFASLGIAVFAADFYMLQQLWHFTAMLSQGC